MSNFDGNAECEAILAHARELFGGRVHEDVVEPEVDLNGSFRPYLVAQFGTPIPTGTDQGLGRSRVQIHILPILFLVVATDSSNARDGAADVLNHFLDWEPGVGNAGYLTGGTGSPIPVKNAAGATIRVERSVRFECKINLSPVAQ